MSILTGSVVVLVWLPVCLLAITSQQRTQATPINKQSSDIHFKCLPPDISLGDVITFRPGPAKNITIKDKLIQLKASCRSGKLVDDRRREIIFLKADCWGNRPVDSVEIQERRRSEIAQLRKRHYVFELPCDPRLP